MAADEIEQFRREMIERTATSRSRRQDRRRRPAARGDEHRRQEGQARRADPLRRLRLDADRRLGRQHRHPHPRRSRLRHAAALRTGRRPWPSPPVLRSQRRRPVQRRICRHPRHPLRLHRQARRRRRPAKPRETVRVHAVRPERDALEILFPRVEGYRVELPDERLEAKFSADSVFTSRPNWSGHPSTKNEGIVGEGVDLTLEHLEDMRPSTILFHLARAPALHQIPRPRRRAQAAPLRPAQAHRPPMAGRRLSEVHRRHLSGPAALPRNRRHGLRAHQGRHHRNPRRARSQIKAILDAYNPTGSTVYVNFTTSKETRWKTDARKCHVNWVVCDSDWEAEFCRVAEAHPQRPAYVKNQSLGFEVPYLMGSHAPQIPPRLHRAGGRRPAPTRST